MARRVIARANRPQRSRPTRVWRGDKAEGRDIPYPPPSFYRPRKRELSQTSADCTGRLAPAVARFRLCGRALPFAQLVVIRQLPLPLLLLSSAAVDPVGIVLAVPASVPGKSFRARTSETCRVWLSKNGSGRTETDIAHLYDNKAQYR